MTSPPRLVGQLPHGSKPPRLPHQPRRLYQLQMISSAPVASTVLHRWHFAAMDSPHDRRAGDAQEPGDLPRG